MPLIDMLRKTFRVPLPIVIALLGLGLASAAIKFDGILQLVFVIEIGLVVASLITTNEGRRPENFMKEVVQLKAWAALLLIGLTIPFVLWLIKLAFTLAIIALTIVALGAVAWAIASGRKES